MSSLAITIKPGANDRKIRIEMDAKRFEKFAASLGLFGYEFMKSLDRAEKDYKAGRTKKIKSLKDLRKK